MKVLQSALVLWIACACGLAYGQSRTPHSVGMQKYNEGFMCMLNEAVTRPDVSYATEVIGATLKGLKSSFGAIQGIKRAAESMEKNTSRSKRVIQLVGVGFLSWLRSSLPLLDANLKTLNAAKKLTTFDQAHRGILYADKIWTPLAGAMLGIKVYGKLMCCDTKFFGLKSKGAGKCLAMPFTPHVSAVDVDAVEPPPASFEVVELPEESSCARFDASKWRAQKRRVARLKSHAGSFYHKLKNKARSLRRTFAGFKRLRLDIAKLWRQVKALEKLRNKAIGEYKAMKKYERHLRRRRLLSQSLLHRHKRTRNHISSRMRAHIRQADRELRALQRRAKIAKKNHKYSRRLHALNQVRGRWSGRIKGIASACKSFNLAAQKAAGPMRSSQKRLASLRQRSARAYRTMRSFQGKLSPFNRALGKLHSALRKKICVTYMYKPQLKWKVWKSKFKKMRACLRLEQILKSLHKAAKPARKLLEKAAKKVVHPIVRPLLKKMPRVRISGLSGLRRDALSLQRLATPIKSFGKRFPAGTLRSYHLQSKRVHGDIRKAARR